MSIAPDRPTLRSGLLPIVKALPVTMAVCSG